MDCTGAVVVRDVDAAVPAEELEAAVADCFAWLSVAAAVVDVVDPAAPSADETTALDVPAVAVATTGIWLMATAPPATLATAATVTTARERHVRRQRFFMAEVRLGRGDRAAGGDMDPVW